MLNSLKSFIFTFLLAIWTVFLSTPSVHAQTLSLSISPPVFEIFIKPGKTISQVYKIRNTGEAKIVKLSVNEYTPDTVSHPSVNIEGETWIKIAGKNISRNSPFLLSKGEEKQFLLIVSPPIELPQKDYYRVITLETVNNPPHELSQTDIQISLNSVLLITVTNSGSMVKSSKVTKFTLPKVLDSFTPLNISVEIENTGDTYLRPIGTLTLKGIIGQGTYNLLPLALFPGQKKLLITQETGDIDTTLKLTGLFVGKYNLELKYGFAAGNINTIVTKSFIALPVKGLVFLLTILLILYILNSLKRMKFTKHKFVKKLKA